jgi:hypothetical protein
MLQDPAWQATDALTRAQLAMFHALGDQINMTENDRRHALNLDDSTWRAWTVFRSDGPLPAEPPEPDMLLRLGVTVFNLSVVAERLSRMPHSAIGD